MSVPVASRHRGSIRLPSVPSATRRPGSLTSISSAATTTRVKREQREADAFLDEALRAIVGPNPREALSVVVRAVRLRLNGPPVIRRGRPLYENVQMAVVTANREGVRRRRIGDAPDDLRFYFERATELLDPPPSPPKRRRSVAADMVAASQAGSALSSFPLLRGYLLGSTLCNLAVLQQLAADSPKRVVESLLRALRSRCAAFATLTLYNLAIVLVSWHRFDVAAEIIAGCSELATALLSMCSPSASRSAAFVDFRRSVARQAVMCHHLVAALAAWCRMREVELYHCHLALSCARQYLEASCPTVVQCLRRLAAAKDGGDLVLSETEPPHMPMLSDDMTLLESDGFQELLREVETVRLPAKTSRCTFALEEEVSSQSPATTTLPRIGRAQRGVSPGLNRSPAGLRRKSGSPSVMRPKSGSHSGRRPESGSLSGRRPESGSLSGQRPKSGSARGQRPKSGSARGQRPKSGSPSPGSQRGRGKVGQKRLPMRREGGSAGRRTPSLSLSTATFSAADTADCIRQSAMESLYSLSPLVDSGRTTEKLPPILTFMPRPAYDRYRGLNKTIRRMMLTIGQIPQEELKEESEAAADSVTDRAVEMVSVCQSRTRLAMPQPGEYMRVMDHRLHRLSRLVPDAGFALLERAVLLAQSHWRGVCSRRTFAQRVAAAHLAWRRHEAATVIQCAMRRLWAIRPCVAELRARAAHRAFVRRVVLVQSFARGRESAPVWVSRVLGALQREVGACLERRRRAKAALTLQSWWRMCRAASALRAGRLAALCVQRHWRGFCGRRLAREVRVRRRLAEAQRNAALSIAAVPLQRRWRAILAIRAARAEVAARRARVEAYLGDAETAMRLDPLEQLLQRVPDAAWHVARLTAALRGYQCRVRCATYRCHWQRLRRALLRFVHCRRVRRHVLPRLERERVWRRACLRRREAVADAAVRVQCAARCWLARRRLAERRAADVWRQTRAVLIQRAYRRHVGRRVVAAARREAEWAEARRMFAQLRHYSAAKIQATWRMHATRRAGAAYGRFLRVERHAYAARVQRMWRMYAAKRVSRCYRHDRAAVAAGTQSAQCRTVAAVRIQSAVRMFLARRQLAASGMACRVPTQARRHRGAMALQRVWRRFAACEYAQQLRLARAYYTRHKTDAEALHTYATMIQSVVRGRLLFHGRRRPLGGERIGPSPMEKDAAAVLRRATWRRQKPHVPPPTLRLTAHEEREAMRPPMELPLAMVQRIGRGAVRRGGLYTTWTQSARWRAALEVQRIWRGYRSRKMCVVVFEYYTEEVEVSEEEEEKREGTYEVQTETKHVVQSYAHGEIVKEEEEEVEEEEMEVEEEETIGE